MGFVEGLRDDDEGFVLAAEGVKELPGGRDGGDGIVLAVDEENGVGECDGVRAARMAPAVRAWNMRADMR